MHLLFNSPCNKHGVKKLSPYKCERLPENIVMYFCTIRFPKLARAVLWELFVKYLIMSSENLSRSQRRQLSKWYHEHPLVREFTDNIQREVNYTYNTYKADHIFSRFGRVYRRRLKLSWHKEHQWYGKLIFTENNKIVYIQQNKKPYDRNTITTRY